MHEIQLLDAWKLWLAGQSVSEFYLWGMNILWWGRIGKIISFFSGLTLIFDLVGVSKVRRFGKSLHAALSLTKADQHLKGQFKYVKLSWKYGNAKSKEERKKVKEELETYLKSDNLTFVICIGIMIYAAYYAWRIFGLYLGWSYWALFLITPLMLIVTFLSLFLIAPLMIFLIVFVFTVVGVIIDTIIIKPVACIISSKVIDEIVKIVAILFLMVGFHFDLLAS